MAGVCTGDGPCVTTPIGLKKNWVTKAAGLPLYIRAIAQALLRSGHDESEAIRLAVGIAKRWASGAGNVTPATRARAAAAIASWEAKRASTHDHTTTRRTIIDLGAAMTTTTQTLPDLAACKKAAGKLSKLPPGLRKAVAARIAARAKQLGGSIDMAVTAEERASATKAGATMAGGKYPTETRAQFDAAVRMVGLGKDPEGKIKAYLIGRAKKMGWPVPDGWD